MPGADSMPEDTSTAHGARTVISPCTLSGVKPPATIAGLVLSVGRRVQSNASPLPPAPPSWWLSYRSAAACG